NLPDPGVTQTIRSRADLDALLDAISLSGGTCIHLEPLEPLEPHSCRDISFPPLPQWAPRAKRRACSTANRPPCPLPPPLLGRQQPRRRVGRRKRRGRSPTRTLRSMTRASVTARPASASATARPSP